MRIAALLAASLVAVAGCAGGDSVDAPNDATPITGATTGAGGTTGASSSRASSSAVTTSASTGSGGAGGQGGAPVGYPVPDWQIGLPEDVGFDPAGLDAAAQVADKDGSFCLLVIRHGSLVYEKYFNGKDAATKNPSWSLAKSYSSTMVGIAIDRGDIKSLDDSVSDYVPEWKGTDHEPIKIRDLVSMTSGLKWSAFDDYVSLATFAQDDTAYALKEAVGAPPGTNWTYDNAAVQVLEPVFRNATGMTIEAYAQKYLWSKIGMTASWKHDPAGNPTTYANVMASCRDHARLGYLYLHGGTWAGGEQIISQSWINQATTPSQTFNRAYGFLFWLNAETPAEDAMMTAWPGRMVPFAPKDLFAARGFGNQFIDVIPSLDLVVVRFGKDPMTNFDIGALTTDSRFATHDEILKPILDSLTP